MKALLFSGRALLLGGIPLLLPEIVVGPLTGLAVNDFTAVGANTIHVVQRAAGATTRDVSIAFTWSGGTPVSVQARVINKTTAAVVVAWTALGGLNLVSGTGGGSGTGVMPAVPQGSPYVIQIRDGVTQPSSGALYSAGSQAWGVGVRGYIGGQSQNPACLISGSDSHTTAIPGTAETEGSWYTAGKNPFGYFGSGRGYHGPDNIDAIDTLPDRMMTMARLLTTALKMVTGADVPVAIAPVWINGSSIVDHSPGSALFEALFHKTGTAAPNIGLLSGAPYDEGDIEFITWTQGQTDKGSGMLWMQQHLATLVAGWQAEVAPYGRGVGALKVLISVEDLEAQGSLGENMREAQLRFVRDDAPANGWTGVSHCHICTDLLNDGLHVVDDAVKLRFMRRMVQSMMKAIGVATYGADGPYISGAVRTSPTNIRLTIVHDAGTALQTPNTGTITGLYLNSATDFSGTDYTYSATTIVDATHVDVTVASSVPTGVRIKYLGKRPGFAGGPDDYTGTGTAFSATIPAIANPLYCNSRYPYYTGKANTFDEEALGFPVRPTAGAIVVA